MTPSVRWTYVGGGPDSLVALGDRQALMRRNVATLREPGVRFVVGSDWFGATAWDEIAAMRALGSWTDAQLLMWIDTPRSIFPQRAIGRLEAGYEASYLVLDENPFERLDALKAIRLRMKQGCVLAAP